MEVEYREYKYRFAIVALFALPSFINGMCWVTLSPVLKKASETYDVSESVVALVPMLYMIMYVFVNFPSNWILDVKGIRKGVIIGAVMTALGAGIRSFISISFVYVIIGQVFCAIAQPFILNAPAKIATFWFKEQNRPLWTAILATINIVGSGIGYVIPAMVVDEQASKQDADRQFMWLMLIECAISLGGALLVIFLFRQSPPTPPSYAADTEKIDFKRSFKILFKNKNFLYLLLAFSFLNGTFNFVGSLMNLIVKPFDYTDDQISYFGGSLIGVGLISACLLSLYVQKVKRYKPVFVACSVVSVLVLLGFSFALYYVKQFYVLLTLSIALGASLTPLLPLSFDFGCEIVFPVGEAQVTGILMTGGQVIGILEIVLLQNVYGLETQYHCFVSGIIVASLLAFGALGYVMVKEKLLRRAQEEKVTQSKESLLIM